MSVSPKDLREAHVEGVDLKALAEDSSTFEEVPLTPKTLPIPRNDLAFAKQFAETEKDAVYNVERRDWFVWSGSRWVRDRAGGVLSHMGELSERIIHDAISTTEGMGEDRAKAINKAVRCGDRSRLEAALALARPMLAKQETDFDTGPWLVGTPSGMVDLQRGAVLPPDKGAFITRALACDPSETANCPTWDRFLATTFDGSEEIISFLRRSVGYSLTGLSREHVLWFLHGGGSNGKTTFVELLLTLFGGYACKSSNRLFCNDPRGRDPEQHLAALKGSRFVLGEELESGESLAEGRVKTITGGDTLTGRHLYGEPFSFSPTHSAWMFGNHKPRIAGTDLGIWRRMCLVPFKQTIPREQRDLTLQDKLRRELPGILRWAIDGCQEWQRDGLQIPDAVRKATDEYRGDEDLLGDFLEERTRDANSDVLHKEVFSSYLEWAEEQGLRHTVALKTLARKLEDRGWKSHKTRAGKEWIGKCVTEVTL